MQPSQLNSLVIPSVGVQNPATLWKAAEVPVRVVIGNIGPNLILLAHDSGTLANSPVFANAFRLATTKELTIVLAPQQGLFAVGVGIGGEVSIAVSEALPII